MKTKKKAAFTLMEIIMVVAILALITVLGVPAVQNAFSQGEDRIKQTNVDAVNAAKEQWALLSNKPDGTAVSWENIDDYITPGIMSLDDLIVNGDEISINAVGTSASY